MGLHYFLITLLLSMAAVARTEIKVLPDPKSPEDFEHQNPGCPENSECDPVMGLQMQNWKNLTKRLTEAPSTQQSKSIQEVEDFRKEKGIPAEFYTYKKSQQGFRPLYFNSPCKDHNPKVEENRVLRGTSFLKGLTKDKATIWRDQTQIEVPVGELLIPQPVTAYFPSGPVTYQLPVDDQPLFIREKALHIVREEEGFFYVLRITPEGEWKIVNVDFTRLSNWEEKREYVNCPTEKEQKKTPKEFGVTFCKTVWDEDLSKAVVVKMHAGCNH